MIDTPLRVQRRAYYATHKAIFKRGASRYEAAHRPAINAHKRSYLAAHPEKRIWINAKHRAKKLGVPFTITETDVVIPEFCPVLGLRLEAGKGRMNPNAPSLDRFIPALGYVPNNIAVISWRANCIKHNATPEELRAVADWAMA